MNQLVMQLISCLIIESVKIKAQTERNGVVRRHSAEGAAAPVMDVGGHKRPNIY